MKKIGIVGSRRRNTKEDYQKVYDAFDKNYSEGDIIISGGCPKGGDNFAEQIAERYDIPITIYKADWNKNGKIAGFMRNTTIAAESDILIACIHESRTGGTEDTIKKFKKFHPDGKVVLI